MMGLLDDLIKKAGSQARNAAQTAAGQAVRGAVDAAGKAGSALAQGKSVIGQTAAPAAGTDGSGPADAGTGHGSQTFVFSDLPQDLAAMQAMAESDLSTPFKAAALTVLALCRWGESKDDCYEMLDYLRGPRPLSEFDRQFIRDRLQGREYLPFSFFAGSTPENGYTPDRPYQITVFEDIYSYQNEGYCRLNIRSSGADSPRQLMLRCQGGKVWRLWENYLLPMIRVPASEDPWA